MALARQDRYQLRRHGVVHRFLLAVLESIPVDWHRVSGRILLSVLLPVICIHLFLLIHILFHRLFLIQFLTVFHSLDQTLILLN